MQQFLAWISCLALIGYAYHTFSTRSVRLGTTEDGVSAFVSSDSSLREINHIKWQGQQLVTGRRWECVEFARRYLIKTKGMIFRDVGRAEEIWNMPTFIDLQTKMEVPCKHYKIGEVVPRQGDLLIWAASEDAPYGHVAIIVQTTNDKRGKVWIAEQNWDNWIAPHYSRTIILFNTPHLLGLIRV